MKRRKLIAAIGMLVLLGVGAGGAWTMLRPSGPRHAVVATTRAVDQGSSVATALRSITTHPERLVPDERRGAIDLADAVPRGTVVIPEVSSWRPASADSGTIQISAERPGHGPVPMLAVMVKQHGTWRLLGTYPMAAG